jgi:hypothetical protein
MLRGFRRLDVGAAAQIGRHRGLRAKGPMRSPRDLERRLLGLYCPRGSGGTLRREQ